MRSLKGIHYLPVCLCVALLAFVAGCGGSSSGSRPEATPTAAPTMAPTAAAKPGAPGAMAHEVAPTGKVMAVTSIVEGKGYAFAPDAITIHVGDTVAWIDKTDMAHTVTANDHSFNGVVPANGSWSHTFTTPGTYHYTCANHPGQVGTVIVVE